MPRGLRFSLKTSLLLVTIAAMAMVIWQLYREVVPLRQENRRLRDELGELSIDDDTQFHAILSPQTDPDKFDFKWRVWVPEGRRYLVHFASENISQQGYPKPNFEGSLWLDQSGEQWIEYQVFKESDSGKWRAMLDTENASVVGAEQQWPEWLPRTGGGKGVGLTTEVFKPDRTIEIARWHFGKGTTGTPIAYPSAGYLIWLEPVK
jgi:hypothetical protein